MSSLTVLELPEEAGQKPDTADQLAAISRNVMAALGRPRDLCHVVVRPLWANYYRVNVLTGSDVLSTRIADSFFVSADNHGIVIESMPRVVRKYGLPGGEGGS